MLEWTADRWASRLSKIIFTAAMVCAMAFAAAAPDRAFAGGDGGGGHEGGPEPQQIVREGEDKEEENVEDGRDEAEKEKQTEEKKSAKLKNRLFKAKLKMNKALQKIIDKQTEMKKKLHSPETYDYSAEKFAEDVREEGKMQQELVPLQEEVRELSKELGVPEPTEAKLRRPDIFDASDVTAAHHLKSERSPLSLLFDDINRYGADSSMIAGTSDRPHGDRPSGSGNVHTETNDPNVYSNPLEYLWCGGEQDEK